MGLKHIFAVAALVLLAACSTTSDQQGQVTTQDESTMNQDINSAPTSDVSAYDMEQTGPTPGSQEDLVATVGDRVFFEYDSSALSAEARTMLEAQAKWLQSNPGVNVVLEGHCDERGTREYNLALGDRRANAAQDYLVALGVDSHRISTISYGKERPAVLGSTPSAWAQNRRAVMVVKSNGMM